MMDNEQSLISAVAYSIFSAILSFAFFLGVGYWILLLQILGFLFLWGNLAKFRGGNLIQLDQLFLFFLLLYSFSAPLSFYFVGQSDYKNEAVKLATVICLFANLGFSLGIVFGEYIGLGRLSRVASFKTIPDDELAEVQKSGYIILLLGVVSSVVAVVVTVGFSAYLSAGYAGRALIKRDAGPIELGLYVSVIGIVLIFISNATSVGKKRSSDLIVAAVVLLFFAYVSYLGVRRPSFLLIVTLASIYVMLTGRLRFFSSLLIALPFFIFFVTFANYRQILSSNGLFYTVDYIINDFSVAWFDLSRTELGAPFKTLLDIISLRDGSFLSEYGFSYLNAVLYVLPSSFGINSPSLSVLYTYDFFDPDFIGIGGNMGFFPVTEAYLNFGIIGVILLFAIFSLLLMRMGAFLYNDTNFGVYKLVFFALLVPWLAFFMRLDFASFAKGFIYSQLAPLILAAFLTRRAKE